MFDSSSRTLLKSAPELPNLDPATIDELLTSAYIELATIRVNSQQASIGPTQELFDRVRRMATTFEAYVALNLRPDQMRSAAFVAATAHRILAGFREARTPDGQKDDPSNLLSKYAISSSISAAILFLIADRSADAAEASLAIDGVSEKNAIRRSLVFSIREFATGRLVTLVERNIPQEFDRREDSDEQATDLLYRECIYALKDLAGEAYSATAPEIDIKERLNNVISLSEAVSYNLDELPGVVYRQFAGPHHLAVLLRSLIDGARDAMLVNVPTPLAANPIEWKKWLAFQAKSRPFLWINHIKAIRTGYLDRGQSMVMTSPTGSGKTTLSVLKIVSTLCAGDSVIYLAPTHALVEQVESDFSGYIKDLKPVNLEEAVIEELGEQLPAFSVMTPERCLALLGFAPALFAKVGLLVFDEFHLIGAEDPELSARVNTRAIDAMIALLSFIGRCPKADLLLLSAMVSNGDEVAAWLSQVKSEKVSAFNDPWKPTRQLRSCVIYDVEEVEAALILAAGQATKEARGKPLVTPLGLFSLISAWHPSQTEKLIVKSLTDRAPALVVNKYGSITANRNEVAAQIAVDYAKAGKKVIVFCSDIKACGSVSDRVNSLLFAANVPLNEEQQSILSAIVSDVGSKEAAFTPDSKRAGVHHGDLLPMERKLTEMLFRQRPEPGSDRRGLEVIAATSTIAQGLNLPCDVVILAGTDRSSVDDFSESPRTDLRPHEILNALGRAGRAGRASYSATGLSIVVPAKPIRVNLGKIDVGREQILKTVFSEGDACEKIFDPIEILLDQVDSSANMDAKAQAMIRRLCSETVDGKSGFEEIVTRSFGYYRKCRDDKAGAEKWVESRRSALKAAEKGLADPEIMDWQYEIAVRNGMPPRFIVQLANAIENFHLDFNHTSGWIGWLLDVIAENPSDLEIFVRESSLESVFGRAYKAGGKSSENAVVILQSLKTLTEMWCSGFTLTEIEDWILKFIHQYEGDVKKKASKSKSAQRARRFAIRITPDLGFLCGVFAQVAAHVIQDQQLNVSRIEMLPQMIKMGDHDWHHMALRQRGAGASRVDSYLSFERLRPYFTADASSDMTAIRRDVNRARTLLPELDGDI